VREVDKTYCDISKVYVAPISKAIAKDIIIKKHYTHAWSMCRYAIGVYHKTEDATFFGEDKLIGCVVYGYPVGRSAAASISTELSLDNVLELTRLYIDDGYGSNIESYAISQSFKWLKRNDKNIKALISYADRGQKHLGKIYQATNWIYQGVNTDMNLLPNYQISVKKNPYKWIHSRTVTSLWGSHNIEQLKTNIGKDGYTEFFRQMESGKHRYIYILTDNKREYKKIFDSIKHQSKPYPKDADADMPEVVRHETYIELEKKSQFFDYK